MTEVLFFIAAIGAIVGAVGVVSLQNPFFSVLALVFHLLSLAALFLLLQAQFVAAAQVVVYAGAVMVLYVFVVAYVGAAEAAHFKAPVGGTQRAFAIGFALALFIELAIAVLGSALAALDTEGPTVRIGFGGPEQIGQALLTRFLVAFEVASFLLLIAAVGAVVLARRRGGIHEEETRVSAMAFLRPPGVGTMAEAVEGRVGTPVRGLGPPEDAGAAQPAEGAEGAGTTPEGVR
jgi:NADH:ubiquinone oxidoreductase subunit 6 (subunit J)